MLMHDQYRNSWDQSLLAELSLSSPRSEVSLEFRGKQEEEINK